MMNLLLIVAASGFLFLKTGEKFATQEAAAPTVTLFTEQVGAKLGEKFEPQVVNDPAKAVEYITRRKPTLGIVTPGFYLTYARALGMDAVAEVKRQKVDIERYVLVTPVRKKMVVTVASPLAAEPGYVQAVILQGRYGDELRLQTVTDVEGAVFDMAEAKKDAADGVVMEEGVWQVLSTDAELSKQLKVAFTSEALPGNLVVTFRGQVEPAKVRSALQALDGNDVLKQIRVASFTEVNGDRLKAAEDLFRGK